MRFAIAPIAGGHFPKQVALLLKFYANVKPPRILAGTSGGAIAMALCAMADFDEGLTREIISGLDHNVMLKHWMYPVPSWITRALPYWLAPPWHRTIFRLGSGFVPIVKPHLESLQKYELYIGAYNTENGRHTIFCNQTQAESSIRLEPKYETDPPHYLDGDLTKVAAAIQVSAAIPGVFRGLEIDGTYYLDGGTMFASPMPTLTQDFRLLYKDFHATYFNVVDSERLTPDIRAEQIWPLKLIDTSREMSTGARWHDRQLWIERVRANENIETGFGYRQEEFDGTADGLTRAAEIDRDSICSMIEFYPRTQEVIDITTANGDDILSLMDIAAADFGIRAYWIEPHYEPQD